MYNNTSTLVDYLKPLRRYTCEIARINRLTNKFLSSDSATNLYFQNCGRRLLAEILGSSPDLSSSEKILALAIEVYNQTKSHLDKFAIYSRVFEELLTTVSGN